MRVTGLIPSRFITIIVHIIVTLLVLFDRDRHIAAALPENTVTSSATYRQMDTLFTVLLAASLGVFAVELFGFLGGFSMFMPSQILISTGLHSAAVIVMLMFLFDSWPATDYWYVFGFCVILPVLTEIITWIRWFTFRPGPAVAQDTKS